MLSWYEYLSNFVKIYRCRCQKLEADQQLFIRSRLLWITFLEPCQIQLFEFPDKVNVWTVTHDQRQNDMRIRVYRSTDLRVAQIKKKLSLKNEEIRTLEYLVDSTRKLSFFDRTELSETLWSRYKSGFFWVLPFDVRELAPDQLALSLIDFDLNPVVKTLYLTSLPRKAKGTGIFFAAKNVPPTQPGISLSQNHLEGLLKEALGEYAPQERGRKFEVFFESMISKDKEFTQVFKHARSGTGEIDYIYRHSLSNHPFWKISFYICIECKNWREKVSSRDIDHLIKMIRAKGPLSSIGIFVSSSSLEASALTSIRDARLQDGLLIVPVEKKHLKDLTAIGFKEFIPKLCEEQVFKGRS
jgi:hypothetical protein